jgi:arsenate reductase
MAMDPPITIYGIKACDTMKTARLWLNRHSIAYEFHEYKAQAIEPRGLEHWVRAVGWEMQLNRAGTTFRKFSDANKLHLDESMATTLMLAQPSMIKRPVLDGGGELIVDRWQANGSTVFLTVWP